MDVLILVTGISPTSIPFETAVQVAEQENCNMTLAVFYGSTDEQYIDSDVPVELKPLGADSRFDPVAWRRFYKEIRSGEYDVLHTHQNFNGSVARTIAKICDISIIDTEHRQHSSYTFLQKLVNIPTLPLADKVVFNSEATKNSLKWYESVLINRRKQTVIHNGVNFSRLDKATENVKRCSTKPRVLSIGRLVPVKNHSTLLEAFAVVTEQVPDAELVLIGDGPLRRDLEIQTKNLGIADVVQFKGQISRKEVYEEIACSDLFTIPSYSEGFCVAAVEAMAGGLPVVASDIDVFREVIDDSGIFLDPHNPSEFADAISRMLKNENRRDEFGRKLQKWARNTFSLECTAKEYACLYRDLAEKQS
jgi:glycosyltransferase involved in cell wall biosynthesis